MICLMIESSQQLKLPDVTFGPCLASYETPRANEPHMSIQNPDQAKTTDQERSTIADLERSIFKLSRAIRKITYPNCSKEASAIDGAGYWQLAILNEVGPQRPSDLAQILSLDISTVSRQLKQLETSGLVERKVHHLDARAYLIMITKSGQKVFRELTKLRQKTISEVVASWNDPEVQSLLALVQKMTEGIEKQLGHQQP